MRMSRQEFEKLVALAVRDLPSRVKKWLDNVDIVVQAWPTRAQLAEAGLKERHELMGFYQGIPLSERASYNLVLPDKITIFQGPIEAACLSRREVITEIRTTVVHELAHHFGIQDERLEELGLG